MPHSVHQPRRRGVLPVLLAGALGLAACAGGPSGGDAASPDGVAATTEAAPSAAPTPDTSGPPPGELVVETLTPPPDPQAPQAQSGDVVVVHYTGWAWSTGEVFDTSRQRGPFTFQLGAGRVIRGWDRGVQGLAVGERVRLTIPPDLAYGEEGAPPAVGPDETLVFDVELVEILQPEGPTASPTASEE